MQPFWAVVPDIFKQCLLLTGGKFWVWAVFIEQTAVNIQLKIGQRVAANHFVMFEIAQQRLQWAPVFGHIIGIGHKP